MKNYFYIGLVFFLFVNCSSEDSIIPYNNNSGAFNDETEEEVNLAPNDFEIVIESISDNSVTINWNEAKDPENDEITYSIFLDQDIVLENTTNLEYQFTELNELTGYSGKVIAKDTNGNETSKIFSFTTEKYYLKFLKSYNYADSNSSQRGAPYFMIKTSDNNYIIVGDSNFNGNGSQFFVLKVDYEGNEIWKKFYAYQLEDSIWFNIYQSTNGFLLAGHHHVLSIDNEGNLLWYKKIQSYDIADGSAEIKSIGQDSEGNIFLVGGRGSLDAEVAQEAVLTKLDISGNTLWEKSFKNSFRNYFNHFIITPFDELIILGSKETAGITAEEYGYGPSSIEEIDFWVLKVDTDGNMIWESTFGDLKYDFPKKIISTSDGNFAFTGFSLTGYQVSEGRIFKMDPLGNELWNISTSLSKIYSIDETKNNGFIVTGFVDFGQYGALGLYKFDSSGNEEWNQKYQESFTYLSGRSVLEEEDGGFRIAGNRTKINYNSGDRAKLLIYKTGPQGKYE